MLIYEDVCWSDLFECGGSRATVEPLTVTENGMYTAPGGVVYSPVTVDVSLGPDDGGDLPFEDLTWDQVIASTQTGKYKTFAVGAMKELDLGSEGVVHMQIVGIDADDLSDGSGKAPLTLISKELLKTRHEMSADGATGAVGGWEMSAMRSYLSSTVFPLIPAAVRTSIRAVSKASRILNTKKEEVNNVLTNDTLWIPSVCEIYGPDAGAETIGCYYHEVFSLVDERIKSVVGEDSPTQWWFRSASLQPNIYSRYNNAHMDGEYYRNRCTNAYGVALGFCL